MIAIFLSTLSLRRATAHTGRRKLRKIQFLSTLSLRRATKTGQNYKYYCHISIHALLAESDHLRSVPKLLDFAFLSTLSLRRATRTIGTTKRSHINFYPRSPCGERRSRRVGRKELQRFLSTLSLRRATISVTIREPAQQFLSTLSLRRAT